MTIKVVLMDLDGTVYKGNEIISGAIETIRFIRNAGMRLYFFTNNSEKTRKEICEKLNKMEIACVEEDVLSSGFIAAKYVSRSGLSRVYVCGTKSLKNELKSAKVKLVNKNPETLIVGMDSNFNMKKLKKTIY